MFSLIREKDLGFCKSLRGICDLQRIKKHKSKMHFLLVNIANMTVPQPKYTISITHVTVLCSYINSNWRCIKGAKLQMYYIHKHFLNSSKYLVVSDLLR